MAVFSQGDVVRVPFPSPDNETRQHRSALVVSLSGVGESAALLWVAMITSAENRARPQDVSIANLETAGLPVPSVVRTTKLATVEARRVSRLGAIDASTLKSVMREIRTSLFGKTKAS